MANRSVRPLTLVAVLCALWTFSAFGGEVTLRAVSGFAPGTTYSVFYEAFIKHVNEVGKGQVHIHYIGGGGKVMNPFEVGNALRTDVVDIANIPGSFYTNILPEADALKMIPWALYKIKGTSLYDLLEKIHETKANAYLLARQKTEVPFHLFLTKKVDVQRIDKMNLSGLKIRVTPIYAPFFNALGAADVRLAPGDVYTALERGVVDGYGWPLQGIFDFGWDAVTKYRVDPGFYSAADEILVNLKKWNSLTAAQRAVLEDAGTWLEKMSDGKDLELNKEESARQRSRGIEVVSFSGVQRARYLRLANNTAWGAIIKASPEYGSKLQQAVHAVEVAKK